MWYRRIVEIDEDGDEDEQTEDSNMSFATPNPVPEAPDHNEDVGEIRNFKRVRIISKEKCIKETVGKPAVQSTNAMTGALRRETFAERKRREHEEYKKNRDSKPAFIPNRGAFFMHDQRSAFLGQNDETSSS